MIIRRKKQLIEADVDGEVVGLQVADGICYGFNESASSIWRLLEQPRSFDELRDLIMREYQVELSRCEAEIMELLRELRSDGLVEWNDGSPGDGSA